MPFFLFHGNNVLYVIDGVPMGNQADRTGDGTGFGAGRTSSEGIASFSDLLTLQGFPKLRHFDNLSGKEGASDGR